MLHAKKMVLVPQEVANNLTGVDIAEAPAPAGSYSKMDSEMSAILKDKKLSDFKKLLLYTQVMERYRSKLDRNQRHLNIFSNFDNDYEDEISLPQDSVEQDLNQDDSDMDWSPEQDMTATQTRRANGLYNILQKFDAIKWDAQGRVKIFNSPAGNLNELVEAASTGRGRPEGWDLFVQFVSLNKIPPKLLFHRDLQIRGRNVGKRNIDEPHYAVKAKNMRLEKTPSKRSSEEEVEVASKKPRLDAHTLRYGLKEFKKRKAAIKRDTRSIVNILKAAAVPAVVRGTKRSASTDENPRKKQRTGPSNKGVKRPGGLLKAPIVIKRAKIVSPTVKKRKSVTASEAEITAGYIQKEDGKRQKISPAPGWINFV